MSLKTAKILSKLGIPALPGVKGFWAWKLTMHKAVAAASHDPDLAFDWICKVDHVESFDDLGNSEGLNTLDAKLASALAKILNPVLSRRIQLLEEESAKRRKMVLGRQVLLEVFKNYCFRESSYGRISAY